MNEWLVKLAQLDRKIIYTLIGLGVTLPLIFPLNLPEEPSDPTRRVFDYIESLPEGTPIILSVDYSASVLPEVHPMMKAVLRHAFARNLRVLATCFDPQGVGLGLEALLEVAKEYDKEYGKDFVYLGYKPQPAAAMLGIGEEIRIIYPRDYYNTPLDSLPVMKGIHTYRDIPLVVSFSGSALPEIWVAYAQARYGAKVATGATAVMAASFYPYLQTGQMIGMLAGMKGAAEYEYLVYKHGYSKAPRPAMRSMDAVSVAHLLIMLFIILGNIGYFAMRRRAS